MHHSDRLYVIANVKGSRAEYRGTIRRNKRRSAGMRVLCVPWKRDIPLDLALGRTIDTRAKGIAILEHVRKMHTHGFAGMRSGMCDLVVTSVKSIPTAVRIKALSRRNCLVASREKVETSRKYERSIAPVARFSYRMGLDFAV